MTNQSIPIINHYVGLIRSEPFEDSLEAIIRVAETIINDLGLNVVKDLSHTFSPKGITLVYILSESHLAIHTWPELGIIHVDLVTCSFRTREEFEKSVKHSLNIYMIRSIKIKSVIIDKL